MSLTIAAAAAAFGRDLEFGVQRIEKLVADAKTQGAGLLVLPDGALGGYLADLNHPDPETLPPALELDDPVFERLGQIAGELVICLGFCERREGQRYNAAVCLNGDGVLGRHRKVHQPPGEALVYAAGQEFRAFDTPLGRVGMLIDYDKTFPEGARCLALDGAVVLACPSAWPTSVTNRAPRTAQDRQTRLFDLYDQARAAENQVVLASANQTGTVGSLRFLGSAKVVGPGGDVLARTWSKAGLAVATIDLEREIQSARRVLFHLKERMPGSYDGLLDA
jgi:nitrilase